MLDFCGGLVSECIQWYAGLDTGTKIMIAIAIFVGLFIFLRIVYYIVIDLFE